MALARRSGCVGTTAGAEPGPVILLLSSCHLMKLPDEASVRSAREYARRKRLTPWTDQRHGERQLTGGAPYSAPPRPSRIAEPQSVKTGWRPAQPETSTVHPEERLRPRKTPWPIPRGQPIDSRFGTADCFRDSPMGWAKLQRFASSRFRFLRTFNRIRKNLPKTRFQVL